MRYRTLNEMKRGAGSAPGVPTFRFDLDDTDSMDRSAEQEKAIQVLDGVSRFSMDELQRIIARLVLDG